MDNHQTTSGLDVYVGQYMFLFKLCFYKLVPLLEKLLAVDNLVKELFLDASN